MSAGADRKKVIKQGYRLAFKDGGTVECQFCNKSIRFYSDLTVDHLLPVSKGGRNDFNNFAPMHYLCNQKKADSLMPEMIYESGILKKEDNV